MNICRNDCDNNSTISNSEAPAVTTGKEPSRLSACGRAGEKKSLKIKSGRCLVQVGNGILVELDQTCGALVV